MYLLAVVAAETNKKAPGAFVAADEHSLLIGRSESAQTAPGSSEASEVPSQSAPLH